MVQNLLLDRRCWILVLLVTTIIVVPFILDVSWVLLLTEFSIMVLFAMAYNLMLGITGMFSFGHGGLFGAGAYILAIAMVKGNMPMAVALTAAPFVTALLTLLIGWFCIRLTGIYFSILTLAFGQLIWVTIWKMRTVTGGDDGLAGLTVPSFVASPQNQYYFILALVVLGLALIRIVAESPMGFTLKTIRENEKRAQSIGINVKRYQLLAFILSGFFTGLAGALFALFQRGAYVEFANVSRAFEPVFAGVLGGMHVFWGPAFGAAVLLTLDKFVGEFTEYWPLVAGCILILLVLFLPDGIMGTVHKVIKEQSTKRNAFTA